MKQISNLVNLYDIITLEYNALKRRVFMNEKGILLSLFSLPSKYGIGDIGHEAYEFIDILSENGIQ